MSGKQSSVAQPASHSVVDYSKWDNIDSSDDENEAKANIQKSSANERKPAESLKNNNKSATNAHSKVDYSKWNDLDSDDDEDDEAYFEDNSSTFYDDTEEDMKKLEAQFAKTQFRKARFAKNNPAGYARIFGEEKASKAASPSDNFKPKSSKPKDPQNPYPELKAAAARMKADPNSKEEFTQDNLPGGIKMNVRRFQPEDMLKFMK